MKAKLLILFGAFLIFPINLDAQITANKKQPYKVWVSLIDGSKEKGVLYLADKQGIKIMNNKSSNVGNLIFVEASKVNLIKIRRKGKIGKGVWIGALSGFSSGILLGLASGDDEPGILSFSKEDKAIAGGITLGVLGTGVGALVATGKKKIMIKGDNEMYKKQLEIISGYSLILD